MLACLLLGLSSGVPIRRKLPSVKQPPSAAPRPIAPAAYVSTPTVSTGSQAQATSTYDNPPRAEGESLAQNSVATRGTTPTSDATSASGQPEVDTNVDSSSSSPVAEVLNPVPAASDVSPAPMDGAPRADAAREHIAIGPAAGGPFAEPPASGVHAAAAPDLAATDAQDGALLVTTTLSFHETEQERYGYGGRSFRARGGIELLHLPVQHH